MQAVPYWVDDVSVCQYPRECSLRASEGILPPPTPEYFPVQAVPYWVDDESVRASMLMSAPEQPDEVAPK